MEIKNSWIFLIYIVSLTSFVVSLPSESGDQIDFDYETLLSNSSGNLNLSLFVPYVGATGDVDLGGNDIIATQGIFSSLSDGINTAVDITSRTTTTSTNDVILDWSTDGIADFEDSEVRLDSDSSSVKLGDGQDVEVGEYNGTDFIIKQAVGSDIFWFLNFAKYLFDGDIQTSGIFKADDSYFDIIAPAGGWARGFRFRSNADDTTLGGFWGRGGSGTSITKYIIGSAYNSRERAVWENSSGSFQLYGNRPDLLFIINETVGAGVATDVMRVDVTNDQANQVEVASAGVFAAAVQGGTPSPRYWYMDARTDGAWNKATFKVDAGGTNGRVGIGLTSSARPTVALDINGTTRIDGNLTIQGNFTGNQFYGSLYIHEDNMTVIGFVTQDVYVPLKNFSDSYRNGFGVQTYGACGIQNLTGLIDGVYGADWSITFNGQTGSTHGGSIAVNNIKMENCYARRKLGSVDTGNFGATCIISVNNTDTVSLVMADEDASLNDVNIVTANIKLERVGGT